MAVNWITFQDFETKDAIFAPWTMALVIFENVNHVRLSATGSWKFLPGFDIAGGPDGVAGLPLADSALMLPGSPAGCLLGRFGGSSAATRPAIAGEGQAAANPIFAIGSHCLIKLPDDVRGPLYVGFNVVARPVTVDKLKLEISGTTFD